MRSRCLVTIASLCLASCGPHDSVEDVRALLRIPERLQLPYIPSSNPPSQAKIELGRRLFHDPRLSANQTQSCASCHLQQLAFTDGRTTSVGSTGEVLFRNSPTLQNSAYAATFTWANNALLTLEDQLVVPLTNDHPVELGITDGSREEVLARLETDPVLLPLFKAAFPGSGGGVTLQKVIFALATFCRTLVSADSPFDRHQAGDTSALSEQQKRGLALFNGEKFECFHCHGGTNLTVSYRDARTTPDTLTTPFFNNGLYNVGNTGAYPPYDQGLYDVTLNPRHRGLFRPPSLRNVALTAPYMHDGSIATLREVILHYAAGGRVITSGPYAGDGRLNPAKSGLIRGFQVDEEEIADVLAFLEALTDSTFLNDPSFDPAR